MGPHAKAGGLADVIAALPVALKRAGAEVSVILPGYKALLDQFHTQPLSENLSVALGAEREPFRILRADGPAGVPLFLIDHPGFFGRVGIYGEHGAEYPDNLRRFIFFGRAAAMAAAINPPDVLHAHDWHAAPAPIVIRAEASIRERFAATVSAFTIHNVAFQGIFERGDYPLLGLESSWFSIDCLEFYGKVNLMKGAVQLADGVSTVSPAYAYEVAHDAEMGVGLEGVFRAKGERFVGILNGADYDEWNPAGDELIPARYTPADRGGKRTCLHDLREQLGLQHRPDVPLVGMISRMTAQKGFDLIEQGLERILALGVQLVILGDGDARIEKYFREAQQRHPGNFGVTMGFDNRLAHRIQAGSDMFLMPSRFEPCGLTQMYALKYGTVPVVRATGGLKDTVTQFEAVSVRGNGFVFVDYRTEAMIDALQSAVRTFRAPALWQRLMDNCFMADFSWARAAREYLGWFERMRRERVTA